MLLKRLANFGLSLLYHKRKAFVNRPECPGGHFVHGLVGMQICSSVNCLFTEKNKSSKPIGLEDFGAGTVLFFHRKDGSTFDENGLNFCVRNGNRWDPASMGTDLHLAVGDSYGAL